MNVPSEVTELTVRRTRNNLAVHSPELVWTVAECNDLRRTHEREVEWVEEQDQVLAFVVL